MKLLILPNEEWPILSSQWLAEELTPPEHACPFRRGVYGLHRLEPNVDGRLYVLAGTGSRRAGRFVGNVMPICGDESPDLPVPVSRLLAGFRATFEVVPADGEDGS